MSIIESTLDKLYAKKAKLEAEHPIGWKLSLRIIDKQIEMFEKNVKN